nr:putative transposase [Ipomoea batatas]
MKFLKEEGAATIKCKECVFHDQEGTVLHGNHSERFGTGNILLCSRIFLDGGCRRTKDDDTEDGGKLWKFVVERM